MSDDIDIGALSEALNYKADNDLGNLMDDGENIANWSSNMTNCITKIPQDIKLEINDNKTITIKAGTKCYIPNGFESDGTTRKFDEYIYPTDYICQCPTSIGDFFLLPVIGTNGERHSNKNATFSGPTQPTITTLYAVWYDTTNNVIKMTNDTGATWIERQVALPIAMEHCITASVESSIAQVFNGFGYIHNIVFTLPDVEFLMPDGFNNDGTLKSRRFVTPTVVLDNFITDTTGTSVTYISPSIQAPYFQRYSHYVESEEQPETEHTLWYNPKTNKMYHSEYTVEFNETYRCYVGRVEREDYKVTSLETHKVFNLNTLIDELNDSMRETVIDWMMPDYSRGISKSSGFISESNGMVMIIADVTDVTTAHVFKINGTTILNHRWGASYLQGSIIHTLMIPKNTKIEYTAPSTVSIIFYPCKGVQ